MMDLRFWLTQCLGILLERQGGEIVVSDAELAEAMIAIGTLCTERVEGGVRIYVERNR